MIREKQLWLCGLVVLFTTTPTSAFSVVWASRGLGNGGGGGFGAASKSKSKVNKKSVAKRVQQRYGGTSPQDIAQGTQRIMAKSIQEQPPHVQMAIQLYQQLQQWNAFMNSLSVLDQAGLPVQQVEGAKRAREELTKLYQEHDIDDNYMHNLFQRLTWDASADAKAARSITGAMSANIEQRIQRACDIAAASMKDRKSKCLDVGCGFGVLVPYLEKAGVSASQIDGVDLSAEMIKNAQELHRGANFQVADFYQYTTKLQYDAVIFCSSLHDMPDSMEALRYAAMLLAPGGCLVVVHPQGASHVYDQVKSNPVLVRRILPTVGEVSSLGLEVEVEPAAAKSAQEASEGYLAVLRKPE